MRTLSRAILRELIVTALLGVVLFTFLIFLFRARPLFEYLVRSSGSYRTVAAMFLLVLPQALPLTVPLAVLVAVLITLSRMSSDGEITAMRAAGIPGRRVLPPIMGFAFVALLIAAASSLWLTPWAIRERYVQENKLLDAGMTADVQPRIFEEQFPNSVVYVTDLTAGVTGRWKRVFLADVTAPENRPPGVGERGDQPRVTLASEAVVVSDKSLTRLQLSLRNGSTYEAGKDDKEYRVTAFPQGDQVLAARKAPQVQASRPTIEMDSPPLYRFAYTNAGRLTPIEKLEGRIEFQQRIALPVACLLMALLGVPLGITRRRAGKSAAVVMTAALAFLYYMGLISSISMARQGSLSPEVAVWLPNVLFALVGIVLIARLERPGEHDLLGAVSRWIDLLRRRKQPKSDGETALSRLNVTRPRFSARTENRWWTRLSVWPQLTDTYVLSSFFFYFAVLLASFVLMFQVFTFFELLSDIIKHSIPLTRVLSYHFFLTPRLIYEVAPFAVLTAVLVTFAVLSKHNEVTALKACGVSVYRLAAPILIAGLVLSGGLFLFDHYWVPEADRRQDALRAEIKGRPAQTFLQPDRKWISGLHDSMYYYRYFDQANQVMGGVNVYEIDPSTFRLKRHISAERARWIPNIGTWVFENGWSRDMAGTNITRFEDFRGQVRAFPELEEQPDYFIKEVKQSRQMNFRELGAYIRDLQVSGFDTVALQVQLQKKFAVPLFALIMVLVSIPFAFMAGNRGTMAGIGVSLGIAIVYWSVGQVFEQFGSLNQLPVQVAAWSPNVIFSLAGMYFLARMRT